MCGSLCLHILFLSKSFQQFKMFTGTNLWDLTSVPVFSSFLA